LITTKTNQKLEETISTPLSGITVDDIQVSSDSKRSKRSNDVGSSSEYSGSEEQVDGYTSPTQSSERHD